MGIQDVLIIMWAMPRLFKLLTNFTLAEFDNLIALVVPTIVNHAIYRHELIFIYIQIKILILEVGLEFWIMHFII